ncbi:HEXXH motif domain-containing protein [Umezawaea endophytica]|uniref:HEXXH motif domain-containing protein n=1 Tax=Umezawaea endophytica TaxID=1654476 RepID=A0A9X2VFP8_9PSEU|nr:HEXXH motif domain-containing protein [Umezawaea endophytica]MCS7475776.1 HEXXH motif domain-containing protein [Umezawaea endophytica]
MFRALLEALDSSTRSLGPFSDVDHAWTVLADAEAVAPEVVEAVLMHPAVGVWSSRVLRNACGAADDSTPLWSEVGVLHAIAGACAVRCGLVATLPVPVVHGAVTLPTVGQFRLPQDSFPVGHAELRASPDGAVLTAFGSRVSITTLDRGFRPARTHRSTADGRSLDVVLDDQDPYREFSGLAPPSPLDGVEVDEWRKLLDEAWRLLVRWHPGYAAELSAGLTALIPIDAALQVVASSSSAAFGGIALSPKRSATELAEALVHEVQHSKLNALSDLVRLHDGPDPSVRYAGWRDDPRPVVGALHGIYAFVSVVEFWHVQRGLVPEPHSRRADLTFALRARQVRRAVDDLRGAAGLTDLGRRFVAGVSVRLAACETADVPEDVTAAVTGLLEDHYATWRLRHVRPRPADVAVLVERWSAGLAPSSPLSVAGDVVASRERGETGRAALLKALVLDPDRRERMAGAVGPDARYALGDRAGAAAGYLRHLRSNPDGGDAWVGLGMALRSPALLTRPEVARAVHDAVLTRTGTPPDPTRLAAWLDPAVPHPAAQATARR